MQGAGPGQLNGWSVYAVMSVGQLNTIGCRDGGSLSGGGSHMGRRGQSSSQKEE